jgi:hypothetical protein
MLTCNLKPSHGRKYVTLRQPVDKTSTPCTGKVLPITRVLWTPFSPQHYTPVVIIGTILLFNTTYSFNPFQSNFSANHILPSISSLPFSYEHNHANITHNHLFTSKHMAFRETERVQPALSVGQSSYCMRKSVGQAPTAEQA